MKYYGEFTDIKDKLYKVSIITNGDSSNTTPIVLGDSPVIIEYLNEDTIYEPTKYSRATIKLVTKDYMPDLYSGSAQGVKVIIEGFVNWQGYLTPNIYTQSYEASIEELELEAIDGLSTLQYYKYKPINGTKEIVSFKDLLTYLFKQCNCYGHFQFPNNIGFDTIDDFYISEQNFFDEDDEPMTCQEVLEELCRYMGVTAVAINTVVYLIDPDYLKGSQSVYNVYDINTGRQFTTSYVNTWIIDNYTQNGATISLDVVFNKVILKDNLYSFDSIIPSIWDDNKLINYGGMWNYNNEIEVVDEDGKGGKHKCFFKYYYNPDYKSYYYHQSTLSPAAAPKTIDYAATQEYVGATICRAYFKKVEEDDDIINNINYTDYLLLHNHDTNDTFAGMVDLGGVAVHDITIDEDQGLPVFELQVNKSNPAFIGGDNTHILIQGNFIYMDREGEMYIMQGYSNKEDNFNTNNLWIKAQLKYGNYYWNGNDWQTTSCCFKLPFYNNGQKDHHINQTFPIKNTVSWEMGIEEDGYLIPLPTGRVLDNKPTFTLYQPHRIDEKYRCDAVWLKDFDIKAVIAHPNQDLSTLDDSDTEYSNVIDTDYVEELELDDFKICTWDNKKPNYSAVCKLSSTGYYFVDNITHSVYSNLRMRPEELTIYRYVNQYSTPSIKLQVSTDIDTFQYCTCLYTCSLISILNPFFIADSFTFDLRYNKVDVTLIEKK